MNHFIPFKRDRNKGQALVEFALILVVLMMLIFVIIEGARLFQGWVTLQNAARAGGRYAITGAYDPACLVSDPACPDPRVFSIKDTARKASTGLPINSKAAYGQPQYHQVEVIGMDRDDAWVPEFAGSSGKPVLVRVSYRMPIITPLLRPIAKSVPLSGQVVLNNENFDQVNSSRPNNSPPNLPPPPTPGPPLADLQIEKSANPRVVLINDQIDYSLRVTNNGPSEARGITVVDTLPAGVSFVSSSPVGACTYTSGVVTCNPPDLPRGAVYDIDITVIAPSVAPPLPGETINEATVTGIEPDGDLTNNSATATTLVVLSDTLVDLEIVSKDDLPDPVVVSQPISYTIVVRNNGVNDATAVTLLDPLPAGFSYVAAIASQGSCDLSSGTVFCTLGDMAVDDTASVEIGLLAPSSPGTIINTASVAGNEVDPDPSNNDLSESTTISPEWTDLFVTIADSPDPAPVAEDLTYSILVGNNGPADGTNVTLTSMLPDSVTFVSATPTQGSCSQSGITVTCNLGTVLKTGAATVNILVTPTKTGLITNQVSVTGDQDDPNVVNDSNSANTTIVPTADMSISKIANPDSPPGVNAGDTLSYHIVATNLGPSPATAVQVIDALPADVSFLRVTTSKGNCSRSGGTLTCDVGNLAVGGSVDIDIDVIPQQEGVIINSASVTSSQFDPNPVDNTARDTTTANPAITAFITLDPVCGDQGASLVVHGFNWPSSGNKDVNVYWDSQSSGNLLGTVSQNGTVWSLNVNVPANGSFGTHTIIADRQNVTVDAAFTIPCPAPNLVIGQPSIISSMPVQVGDPVTFQVDISNIGDMDAVSQFFVGLYFDPPQAPDADTTHLPQNYRAKIVAISGLTIGASKTISLTAETGFTLQGPHDVYIVIDSDPGPEGIIDESLETDNISPPLQVIVDPGSAVTPTPGPTPEPTNTPDAPGSLIGQSFLISSGGQAIPQAGVEVRAYDAGSGALTAITYTDVEGTYFFAGLNPSTYTISGCIIIDGGSFTYAVTGVVVNSGQIAIEDIFLEPGLCS